VSARKTHPSKFHRDAAVFRVFLDTEPRATNSRKPPRNYQFAAGNGFFVVVKPLTMSEIGGRSPSAEIDTSLAVSVTDRQSVSSDRSESWDRISAQGSHFGSTARDSVTLRGAGSDRSQSAAGVSAESAAADASPQVHHQRSASTSASKSRSASKSLAQPHTAAMSLGAHHDSKAAAASLPASKQPSPATGPPGRSHTKSAGDASGTLDTRIRTPSGAVVPLSQYDPAVHGWGQLEPVPEGPASSLKGGEADPAPTTPPMQAAPLSSIRVATGTRSLGPSSHRPALSMASELASPAVDELEGEGGTQDEIEGTQLSLHVPAGDTSPFVLPSLRKTASPGTEPFLPMLSSALVQQYSAQQDRSLAGAYSVGPQWNTVTTGEFASPGELNEADLTIGGRARHPKGAGTGVAGGFIRTKVRDSNITKQRREARQASAAGDINSPGARGSSESDVGGGFDAGEGFDGVPPRNNMEALLWDARSRVVGDELDTLDYTPLPVTVPAQLASSKSPYALRMRRFGRFCRLAICVTCYNEDEEELRETLEGISENLPYLARMGIRWENILVVVVIDGRSKANPKMLQYLHTELAAFNGRLLRSEIRGDKSVTMHMLESTVEVPNPNSAVQGDTYGPMQLAVALKENNGGKLNSHLWFFDGICASILPEYAVLLDVGTRPAKSAIARLINVFEQHPMVGGTAGEIAVRDLHYGRLLEAAQSFEYQIAHDLDKTFESAMGYVSVLPGAFSAYRWDAIEGEPLKQYFLLERKSASELGPFTSNMYLAEDRVLCQEILLKRNEGWTLYYEASAQAYTDVPQTLQQLIKQRRRWLNGSLFALLSYLYQFSFRIYGTAHPCWRKCVLSFQWVFIASLAVIAWFSVGLLFISYLVIFSAFFDEIFSIITPQWDVFIISSVYAAALLLLLIVSLVGDVGDLSWLYGSITSVFAVASVIAIVLSVVLLANVVDFTAIVVVALVASLGPFILAPLMQCKLVRAGLTGMQYFFFIPTYVNSFQIHSLSNLQNISWGTREGGAIGTKRKGLEERSKREARRAEKGQELLQAAAREAIMGGMVATDEEGHTAAQSAAGRKLVADLKAQLGVEAEDDRFDAEIVNAAEANALLGDGAVADITGTSEGQLEVMEELQRVIEVHRKQADEALSKAAQLKLDTAETALRFNNFRLRVIIALIFSNTLLVALALTVGDVQQFALVIALFITWSSGIKMTGAVVYGLDRCLRRMITPCCGCFSYVDRLTGKRRICCASPQLYRSNHRWLTRHGFAERDVSGNDIAYLQWRRGKGGRNRRQGRAARLLNAPASMEDTGATGSGAHECCHCCMNCCCTKRVGYKRDLVWALFQEHGVAPDVYYDTVTRSDLVPRRPNWIRKSDIDTGLSRPETHHNLVAAPYLPLEDEMLRERELEVRFGSRDPVRDYRKTGFDQQAAVLQAAGCSEEEDRTHSPLHRSAESKAAAEHGPIKANGARPVAVPVPGPTDPLHTHAVNVAQGPRVESDHSGTGDSTAALQLVRQDSNAAAATRASGLSPERDSVAAMFLGERDGASPYDTSGHSYDTGSDTDSDGGGFVPPPDAHTQAKLALWSSDAAPEQDGVPYSTSPSSQSASRRISAAALASPLPGAANAANEAKAVAATAPGHALQLSEFRGELASLDVPAAADAPSGTPGVGHAAAAVVQIAGGGDSLTTPPAQTPTPSSAGDMPSRPPQVFTSATEPAGGVRGGWVLRPDMLSPLHSASSNTGEDGRKAQGPLLRTGSGRRITVFTGAGEERRASHLSSTGQYEEQGTPSVTTGSRLRTVQSGSSELTFRRRRQSSTAAAFLSSVARTSGLTGQVGRKRGGNKYSKKNVRTAASVGGSGEGSEAPASVQMSDLSAVKQSSFLTATDGGLGDIETPPSRPAKTDTARARVLQMLMHTADQIDAESELASTAHGHDTPRFNDAASAFGPPSVRRGRGSSYGSPEGFTSQDTRHVQFTGADRTPSDSTFGIAGSGLTAAHRAASDVSDGSGMHAARRGLPPLPSGSRGSLEEEGVSGGGAYPPTPGNHPSSSQRDQLYSKVAAYISANAKSARVQRAYNANTGTTMPQHGTTLQRMTSAGMMSPKGARAAGGGLARRPAQGRHPGPRGISASIFVEPQYTAPTFASSARDNARQQAARSAQSRFQGVHY